MHPFYTQKKFLSFSEKKRHKLAAELIKQIHSAPTKLALENYESIHTWLRIPPLCNTNFETLSDRYHYHLEKAHITLKEYDFLESMPHCDSLTKTPFLEIDIYLDKLRSTHNIGSIIRTTEAFRLGSIYLHPECANHDHEKVKKSAMGTESLVSCQVESDLTQLKSPRIAIEISKDSKPIYDYNFPKSFTLMLGNEEYGLSKEALDIADDVLAIPLYGSKNSLNVSCAFSIVASMVCSQQRA